MKRKIISIVTAICMVVALVPATAATAFAADGSVAVDASNFPDSTFRTYVSDNFDTDKDGTLSESEIKAAKTIDVNQKGITTLQGIEYLTSVQSLDCSNNKLTSLDVSELTKMSSFVCDNNQLTSLDVSKNTNLMYLMCAGNQLKTLDLSNNKYISSISCENNNLYNLDLRGTMIGEGFADYWKLGANPYLALTVNEKMTALSGSWFAFQDVKIFKADSESINLAEYGVDANRIVPESLNSATITNGVLTVKPGAITASYKYYVNEAKTISTTFKISFPSQTVVPTPPVEEEQKPEEPEDSNEEQEPETPVNPPEFSTKITKVSTAKNAPYVQYNAVKVNGATKTTYDVKYKTGADKVWVTAASATTKTKLTIKALAGKKNYAVIVTPSIVYNGKTYKGPAAVKYSNIAKPAGTAIGTAAEFTEKISSNLSGKYYLVSNISLPANTEIAGTFSGMLDGNGFAITGYKYTASSYCDAGVFNYASGATFKNLKMTGVNVSVNSSNGAYVGALVRYATKCNFNNVKVAGKINVSGQNGYGAGFTVGGISAASSYSIYKNCTNDIDITVKNNCENWAAAAGGISSSNSGGTITGCTNTGKIVMNGYAKSAGMSAAGLIGGPVDKAVNCKNSAPVTVTIGKKTGSYGSNSVAGVCLNASAVTGCTNTAAITVTGNSTSAKNILVAGVVSEMTASKGSVSKCSNKGTVKFAGKVGGGTTLDQGLKLGGVAAEGANIGQCYNKGTVTATVNAGFARVGGVAGLAFGINNSYNAGAVKLTGKGFVGGLGGDGNIQFGKATCNYNTGAVTGKKCEGKGAIFGLYSGAPYNKTTFNNYYKNKIKAYGKSEVTNKYGPKAAKVSKINFKKCPKLSKNYWKYSNKKGRLILKNNSEL